MTHKTNHVKTVDQFIVEINEAKLRAQEKYESEYSISNMNIAWEKLKETLPEAEQAEADMRVRAVLDAPSLIAMDYVIHSASTVEDYLAYVTRTSNYSNVSWECFKKTLPVDKQADAERKMREAFGSNYIGK